MLQFMFPSKYAYSFIASISLMPVVLKELQTRSNALKVRAVQFSNGTKGLYDRLRLFTVPIFAQSIRRAQRAAVAIEAKRFHIGSARTSYYETTYALWDALFVVIMVGLFTTAYVLA